MILAHDKANSALRLNEKRNVEQPFFAQLQSLGA